MPRFRFQKFWKTELNTAWWSSGSAFPSVWTLNNHDSLILYSCSRLLFAGAIFEPHVSLRYDKSIFEPPSDSWWWRVQSSRCDCWNLVKDSDDSWPGKMGRLALCVQNFRASTFKGRPVSGKQSRWARTFAATEMRKKWTSKQKSRIRSAYYWRWSMMSAHCCWFPCRCSGRVPISFALHILLKYYLRYG